MEETPLLSIITVTYNASKALTYTLEAFAKQKHHLIEHVIIDGVSSDDTLSIIDSYRNIIDVFVTEKDNGIYDAMNKGIDKSSGDYIWFINAGDIIAPSAIETILSEITKSPDLIYGETMYVNEKREKLGIRSEYTSRKLPINLKTKDFLNGQVISHQSFIAKRTLVDFYDLNYQISADYDWMIKITKKSKKIIRLKKPISYFLKGGISRMLLKTALLERIKIMKMHFGLINTIVAHTKILFRGIIFLILNKRID